MAPRTVHGFSPVVHFLFLCLLLTLAATGCAGGPRATGAPAPPPPVERDTGVAADQSAGQPAAAAQAAPAEPVVIDRITVLIDEATHQYELGEAAFHAGNLAEARTYFDAAVLKFIDSGEDLASNPRLNEAYERIVGNIRAIESQAMAEVEDSTVMGDTPVEEIQDITSFMSPDELEEEREKFGPGPDPRDYSIPVVLNERVLTFIEAFENTPRFRDAFRGGYQRMGRYEKMIREILEEEGVPQDLIYLSFIESTFKPNAYSHAKAKGMWQFMAATGQRYGLRRDYYLDERSDPEKATRAAARYLRDLHDLFGDWYLAMAAYNAGEAKVGRAIQRSGKRDFWELARTRHLRTETKNFVPSILALSIMSRDPARYGHGDLVKEPPQEFDWVSVDGPTDLDLVASLAGTTTDRIRELNPHIRRNITPPGETGYRVRVPVGSGESFQQAYAALPDSEKIASVMARYTVRNGDTLSSIARSHGTTVAAIAQANSITSRTRIYAGSTLVVPRGGSETAWRDSGGGGRGSWEGEVAGEDGVYTIVRGDTLSSIARRHGTSVAALADLNGIAPTTVLRVGQQLRVVPGADPGGTLPGEEILYTVRRGDTLSLIAGRHATTLVALESINGITRHSVLYPGQKLRIHPGGAPGTRTALPGQKVDYTVRRGDSLFQIATRYGTTVARLQSWNKMGRRSRIYPGEVLSIYVN